MKKRYIVSLTAEERCAFQTLTAAGNAETLTREAAAGKRGESPTTLK
jgi:hypothetical protein